MHSFESWRYLLSAIQPPDAGCQQVVPSGYALGLFFIFLQCVVWIIAAIITQFLFSGDGEAAIDSAFLMTYVGMSLLSFYLPIKWLLERVWFDPSPADVALQQAPSKDSLNEELAKASGYHDFLTIVTTRTERLITERNVNWNHRKHMLAALHIAPMMFLADYAFNRGLGSTSIASCTVLVSTQSVFVFLFAVLVKVEKFFWIKLVGVILGVVGTAMTAWQDIANDETENNNNSALLGDVCAVLAAVGYATYTVQVRVLCPQDEELYSMQLLLGYTGFVCMVPLFPFAAYMFWTQVDFSWELVGLLTIKGLLDFVITDYCLFRAVVLTNATTATVGLGLSIPMAFVADWALGKLDEVSILSVMGALAISVGFLVVNLGPEGEEQQDDAKEETNQGNIGPGQGIENKVLGNSSSTNVPLPSGGSLT